MHELRDQFPITRNYNFLNHASVAPLSQPAAQAMIDYAREFADASYLPGTFHQRVENVRQSTAKLINADADEVTFVKNTSEGINYVANGIQWAKGDRVVLNSLEFPANVMPWLNLEQRGVELKFVEDEEGRIPFDRLAQAIDRRTRVLTISAVQWSNGFRTDLVRLGELCKEKGVLLVVDAIQALGVHPIDVQAMNIDFLAADGHKWLCAPEGAGVFYCCRELVEHLRPTEPGYLCLTDDYDQPYQLRKLELKHDARRFDSGAYNIAGIAAMGASIELLLETGVDTIQKHIKTLTDELVTGLREIGWRVHSPRTASEWSGIVSFSHEKHDLADLRRHLQDEFRIIVAHRGGKLRASPHAYNTSDEIQQLITALPNSAR